MTIKVRDAAAYGPERIDAAAAIGKGNKQILFKAIYHGRSKTKSISQLLASTGLGYQRAIDCGGELVKKDICEQTKKDGELAYVMIPFIQANKNKITELQTTLPRPISCHLPDASVPSKSRRPS